MNLVAKHLSTTCMAPGSMLKPRRNNRSPHNQLSLLGFDPSSPVGSPLSLSPRLIFVVSMSRKPYLGSPDSDWARGGEGVVLWVTFCDYRGRDKKGPSNQARVLVCLLDGGRCGWAPWWARLS